MNHFIAGILKIALLEAQAAVVLFDRLMGDAFARGRRIAFIATAALLTLAWANYGGFGGRVWPVHHWEQFHFYLGAKYQKEVGWFDLYRASILADAETVHILTLTETRDLSNFEMYPVQKVFDDAERIKGRFTPERWVEFKADWTEMSRRPMNWNAALADHGNSNSPAWSLIVHPLTSLVSPTVAGQTLLALLDPLLMLAMFWLLFKTFGVRAGAIALSVFATPPNVFDYLSGSILRWDWLFCLGLAACFLKRERFATAGAFFGYAVATKLFPIFFGVALLVPAALETWKARKLPRWTLRFGGGAVASLVAAVLLSSAMFGGTWVWADYKKRIDAARYEKYYTIQYSLKTVYLQFANSTIEEAATGLVFPREIKQARADVDIENHRVGFFIAQLAFTALALLLALRAGRVEAFTLGPLLVFIWLTVNMYYWNMLGLLALGLALRPGRGPIAGLLGLNFMFSCFYLYQHTNHGASEPWIVALLLCVWLIAIPTLWFFENSKSAPGGVGARLRSLLE